MPIWRKELTDDEDKQFLLHGLEYGLPLIDADPADIRVNHLSNHKSCTQHCKKVSKRLWEEIQDGNYVETSASEVKLISPLAANLKPVGDVRVIHDISYPENNSLNDYASKEVCEYESLAEAIDNLQRGM